MKYQLRFVCALLLAAASAAAFADADSAARAKQLVQGNQAIDEAQLGRASAGLTDNERLRLYDSSVEEIDGKLPLAVGLNFFMGYGIGSFVQGDMKGGAGILIGQLASGAALFGGLILISGPILSGSVSAGASSDFLDFDGLLGPLLGGFALTGAGSLGFTVVGIIAIVAPFTYAANRRKALRNGLINKVSRGPAPLPRLALSAIPQAGGPANPGLGFLIAL
jgi:hypothetical protein